MAIVIKRIDGGVSVLSLIGDADEETEVEKWKKSSPGEYVSHREMSDSVIPVDRTFRASWVDTSPDPVIDHDMEKCREIWKDRMREARKPKFEYLDCQFMVALETGSDASEIIASKKELRDVTIDPRLLTASTPDDLKSVWPEVLM
jgi:hypothetical protein